MKQTGILAVLTAMILVAGAVCVPAQAGIIGQNDEQVRAIAEPIMDTILEGLNRGDYLQYSRDFDMTLKEAITRDRFADIQKDINAQFGEYLFREYLGFLNREAFTIVLWKGVFGKTKDEVLIKLVISERNGRYQVTGLWYQ